MNLTYKVSTSPYLYPVQPSFIPSPEHQFLVFRLQHPLIRYEFQVFVVPCLPFFRRRSE